MRSSLERVKDHLLDDTLKGMIILAVTGSKDVDWTDAEVNPRSDPDGNVELHIVGYMHNDPSHILQQVSDAVDERIDGGVFSSIIRKWRRRLFVH